MVRLLAIYCPYQFGKKRINLFNYYFLYANYMHYPDNAIFDLEQLLDACAPGSLLTVGNIYKKVNDSKNESYLLGEQYQEQRQSIHKPCEISRLHENINISHALFQQRYDLAIVAGTLESVDTQTAQHILGRLRDLCVPRLALLVDLNHCNWSTADLLGFGLVRVQHYDINQTKPVVLYHYNIDTYKKTPDWFNAKNWANPKLWNKFWW